MFDGITSEDIQQNLPYFSFCIPKMRQILKVFAGSFHQASPHISENNSDNTAAKDVVNISGPKKDDCRWGCGGKITTILRRALFYFEQFFLEIAHRDLRRSVQKKYIPIFVTV